MEELDTFQKYTAHVFETAVDGMVVIDAQGLIRALNPAAAEIFGYAPAEALGRNVSQFMPEPHRSLYDDYLRQYQRTGKSTIIGSRIELQGRRKNGELFPMELAVSAGGDKSWFTAIVRDISSRKRQEQALLCNKSALKDAQRIAKIGSWELDLSDNRLHWSDEIFRIFEIDPGKFGASYEAFLSAVHPEDRERVHAAYTLSLSNRTPYEIVHRLQMPDGRIKYVREACETYFNADHRPLRSLGTVQDITELHKAEAALQLQSHQLDTIQRAQARFIAGADPYEFFDELLHAVLSLTESRYGFIAEVRRDGQNRAYLKSYAIGGNADAALNEFVNSHTSRELEFRDLNNLFGQVVSSGKAVINNRPTETGQDSPPQGHPPMENFLGVPISLGERLLGMVGLANRAAGYDTPVIGRLAPILGTCAQLIDALTRERERRRAVADLKRAMSFMSGIIHNIPFGVLVENERGEIYAVNQVYCDLFRKDELPLMLEGGDCGAEFAANEALYQDPLAFAAWRRACLEGTGVKSGEELLLHDGRVLQQGYVPVFFEDVNGTLQRNHLWNFHEISEHKRMLNLLEQQGAHLEQMRQFVEQTLDTLTASVCVLDETGQIIYVNKAWREFGRCNGWCDASSGLGQNYLHICDCAADDPEAAAIARSLRALLNEECASFQAEYACHDAGENRWFLLRASRFSIGQALRVVITHDNVTALRQAVEDAQAAAKAKSRFLATMSHEIRTPMNGVLGMLQLLGKTELNTRQQRYVDTAASSGAMLLAVINDILDFSKLEAGKLQLESIPFDPAELVEDIAALMAKGAHEKGLELISFMGPGMPPLVAGDPTRLRQVLTNLVANAIKFTDRGDIVLYAVPLESNLVHFGVRDTGMGIAEENQKRLFEAFTQADSSHTRKYGGTGLGLAICRRLVQAMGGQLELASAPGVGTDFGFDLSLEPVTAADAPPPAHIHEPIIRQRVFIVDDSHTKRDVLTSMLSNWGVSHIEAAATGEEALHRLRGAAASGEPFDIVLLDQQMPGLNGAQVAKAINEDSALRNLRIVMLSTLHPLEADIAVHVCVPKPVRQAELYDVLVTLLSGTTAEQVPRKQATEWWFDGRVLLVEDNAVNQEVAREILRQAGLAIDIRDNGLSAVKAVQEHQYDLVLMDIQMPVLDGLEASRQIRALGGRFTQLPILAMTAHALSGDADKSLAAGMNAHVTKPIEPQVLFKEIARWLPPKPRPAAEVSPAPARPTTGDNSMPESLPGIDLADGLDRLCGNWETYRYILLHFRDNQADAAQHLQTFIDAGRWEEATRLAHTLKGSGGNLGAMGIYHAAAALEQTCRKADSTAAGSALAALQAELNQVLGGLAQLGECGPVPEPEENNPSVSPQVLITLARKLLHAMDKDLGEAQTRLTELRRQAAGSPLAGPLAKAAEALKNFDTEAAKEHIEVALHGTAG